MTSRELAASARSGQLRASIARFGLVFVQFGAAFEPFRELALEQLRGTVVPAKALIRESTGAFESKLVVVTELENLLDGSADPAQPTLGALRELIMREMDNDVRFCIVSRAPRVAFSTIPGSSVLEDASLFSIPLLDESECVQECQEVSGWRIPAATFSDEGFEFRELMTACLRELGTGVLSAVDHALFEVDPRSADALKFLGHRDLEALRGAGLVTVDDAKGVALVGEHRLLDLRSALSDLLSADSDPPQELGQVVSGLWYIERTIRAALRTNAISNHGQKWRGAVLPSDLAKEVLRRARLDSSPSAASVKELRDPIEWLTLGELMSLVSSTAHKNVGVDPVIWRRFNEQLVPIRNRISHMRYLKSGDEEAVTMWVGVIKQQLDR